MNFQPQSLTLLNHSIAKFVFASGFAIGATTCAFGEVEDNLDIGASHPESEALINQFGITGNWGGRRQALEDNGIVPYATYIGEVFTNHRGGIDTGTVYAGLLDVGIELDLDKLVGWEGASFFANAFFFNGDNISGDFVGDFNVVSNFFTNTSFNIFSVFLQQSFGEGDSFLKFGQVALDDDFMVSETALLFIGSGFGPLTILSGNVNAPIYGLAAPGALVNLEANDTWFFKGGIYAGDAGQATSGNVGFDWNLGDDAGLMLIGQAGFKYGREKASVFTLGGYYHTGKFERFTGNGSERGLSGFYAMLDHELIHSDGQTGLNVFLRGGFTPEDEIAAVDSYFDAGVVAKNLFHDGDALGFAASATSFTEDFRQTQGGRSSEIVLELTYQIPLGGSFVLQPDIQYIKSPQSGGRDAFLTALRAEIAF